MIITDPPFDISNRRNVSNDWNGYTSFKGDWDVDIGVKWVEAACRALKPGGIFSSFGVFGSQVPIYLELERLGMQFQSHVIWEKSNPAPSLHRRMYTHANEIILIYSKGGGWTFNYEVAKDLAGGKQLKNVWKLPVVRRIMDRTRKPPLALRNLILPMTDKGDWIVDPFCGTGSMLEVAESFGRNSYGIDTDEKVLREAYRSLKDGGFDVRWEGKRGKQFAGCIGSYSIETRGDGSDECN